MKEIVMIFGRMNPPSIGHDTLIKFAKSFAKDKGCKLNVFLSKKQDNKNNPLSFEFKLNFLQEIYPEIDFVIHDSLYSPFHVIELLLEKGYDKIHFVVGSDRFSEFQENTKKYYHDNINIINSGERVKGISSTVLRNYAINGDLYLFYANLPPHVHFYEAKILLNEVRRNLV